ncbi:MAG TPA: hypothetical protein VLT85_11730, partial [Terriglobales bacterium]|nr:hypothetical protein [Terriglobales bacterium]
VRRQRERFRAAIRAYLASAAQGDWEEMRRARARFLEEYLELAFRLRGGGRCTQCGAAVRHPKPVTAFLRAGGDAHFPCLCLRCLLALTAVSCGVVESVGPVLYEYCPPAACRLSWRRRAAA